MTQPAVHQPVDHHDGGALPVGAVRPGRAGLLPALPWKGLVAIAAAGLPVGLLWWLLAPTGLNLITRDPALAAGSNPETWLPRDLVLAGLFLLAGCLSGVLIAGNRPARLGNRDGGPGRRRRRRGRPPGLGDRRARRQLVGRRGGHLGQRQHRVLAARLRHAGSSGRPPSPLAIFFATVFGHSEPDQATGPQASASAPGRRDAPGGVPRNSVRPGPAGA